MVFFSLSSIQSRDSYGLLSLSQVFSHAIAMVFFSLSSIQSRDSYGLLLFLKYSVTR